MADDLYKILGVTPDAEPVVITAAYRALAAKYHPDRATDKVEAHRVMSAINRAYEVLGNPERRKEYDRTRTQGAEFSESRAQEDAFSDALESLEDRWQVACGVFPELTNYRTGLARTSYQLAFAYVIALLESRKFERAGELASKMERQFLQRYFGVNDKILQFVRNLIAFGERDAVKALNRLVDVLGSGVDPGLLISKVSKDFNLDERFRAVAARQRADEERRQAQQREEQLSAYAEEDLRRRVNFARNRLLERPSASTAKTLAELLDYDVEEIGQGLLVGSTFHVRKRDTTAAAEKFRNVSAFVEWAKRELLSPAA